MAFINKDIIYDESFKRPEDEVLLEILLAFYSERPILLCVDDELYSYDYANLLINYLYCFMPQSLIRDYKISVGDDKPYGNARIISVDKSKSNGGHRAIRVNQKNYICIQDSTLAEVLREIINMGKEEPFELDVYFSGFETFCLCGNYYSVSRFTTYRKNYIDIMEHDDCDVANMVLETALKNGIDDFSGSLEMFDKIKSLVKMKYNNGLQNHYGFSVRNLEDVFNPAVLLKRENKEIKKICYMSSDDESAKDMIIEAYTDFIRSQPITREFIFELNKFMETPFNKPKDAKMFYKDVFNEAYSYVFSVFIPAFIDEFKKEREYTNSIIIEYLRTIPYLIDSVDNVMTPIRNRWKQHEVIYSFILRENMLSYLEQRVVDIVYEHNKSQKNAPEKASESDATSMSAIYSQIESGNYKKATESIAELLRSGSVNKGECVDLVYDYLNAFGYESLIEDGNPVYLEFFKHDSATSSLLERVTEIVSPCCLILVIKYCGVVDMFARFLSFIDYTNNRVRLLEYFQYELDEFYSTLIIMIPQKGEISDYQKTEICNLIQNAIGSASKELLKDKFFCKYINTLIDVVKGTGIDVVGLNKISSNPFLNLFKRH